MCKGRSVCIMAPRKKRVSTIKAENDKGQKRKIKEESTIHELTPLFLTDNKG